MYANRPCSYVGPSKYLHLPATYTPISTYFLYYVPPTSTLTHAYTPIYTPHIYTIYTHSLGRLEALEELVLSENGLVALPAALASIGALRVLLVRGG
jgi:hypothetical protein